MRSQNKFQLNQFFHTPPIRSWIISSVFLMIRIRIYWQCLFHLSILCDQSRVHAQSSIRYLLKTSLQCPQNLRGREETTHYITPIIKSIHVTSLEISFTRVPPLEQQRPAISIHNHLYAYIYTYICIHIRIHR